ncbi:hypothetical protein H5T58_03495, partial [Candidatus Parcubacteria bacterium]|nr:hypothetical protein [Candidatus Parcubacteria bacterium]
FISCFKLKREWQEKFLFSFWFFSLLPGILTKEGIPHSLRTLGSILPTLIFASIGADFLKEKLENLKFKSFLFILFFLILIFGEWQRYFIIWAHHPDLKGAFTERFLKEGEYLNSLSDDFEKFVIVNEPGVPVPFPDGIPMPAQTIIFLENSKYGTTKSHYLLPEKIEEIKIKKRGVILPMRPDEAIFQKLKEKFLQGKIEKINDFSVFFVEK